VTGVSEDYGDRKMVVPTHEEGPEQDAGDEHPLGADLGRDNSSEHLRSQNYGE
jgi:hypothetical protein